MADTDTDTAATTDGVIAWLNSSGATVELFVARTLAMKFLSVIPGLYLPDPETDTAREIDVIGCREVHLADVGVIAAYLVIECKYTPKPWVIVRGRPEYESAIPNFDRITTTYGHEVLDKARLHPAVARGHIFQQEPRPGHSLVTAHVNDEDRGDQNPRRKGGNIDSAYAAIMGATKSARAWADDLSAREDAAVFGVVFPVVVVRGLLYEAWLEGDAITARPIEAGQVYWNHPSVKHPVLVDIVRDSAFETFAQRFRESADSFVTYGKDAAGDVNTTGVY